MLPACIYNQITALLDPAQHKLDTVQDLNFLVAVVKGVQAAMKALPLLELHDRGLVRTINKYISGKPPFLPVVFQKVQELPYGIRWRKRLR